MKPTDHNEAAGFDTPIPGRKIPDTEALALIERLEERFRRKDPALTPTNLPLACALEGTKNPSYLNQPQFLERVSVLLLVEGAHLMHEVMPQEILTYLNRKEPWEDYDICIFDRTIQWCVGITHNGDVFVVE